MADIEVSIDIEPAKLAMMLSGLRSQVPYAISVALNTTANDAQAAIRQTLNGHFTLRREAFIKQTIYRGRDDFAKKDRLVATVRVNPARDVLAKFETDTEKRPRRSNKIAIPVFRQETPKKVIGKNDPRSLPRVMALIDQQGGKEVGPFKKAQRKAKARQSFYLLTSKRGDRYVMERTGPENTRVLYAFRRRVPIKPVLRFRATANAEAERKWEQNVSAAINRAIETMR
jgi:hypothetical protein